MTHDETTSGRGPTRSWPRAAALLGVVLFLSVIRPSVLIAIPVLALFSIRGIRGRAVFIVMLAMLFTMSGNRDGIWFAERAWGLMVTGWFVALTMAVPTWRLTSRALGAVMGSLAASVALLSVRAGAWSALDWTVSDALSSSAASTLDALTVMWKGRPVSPAVVTTMYQMVEYQAAVFPALIGLASMAALGVAWWIVTSETGGGDQGIGPIAAFRFNDQLVWLLIGGLLLLVTRWGDALGRIGANAVVFMGALYAVRGAGVVMFVSRGLSLFGYGAVAVGLLFFSPFVVGIAMMIGIADTWLDLRARAGSQAA